MPDGAEPQPRIEAPRVDVAGRVGPAKADAILVHARCAFVEKGFGGASMQDLARAAGMSAGNFYRYFPSKDAIVEALIERDLHEIEDTFQAILASPDPTGALLDTLRERMADKCEADDTLWAEIAATSIRRPEIAAILRRMEDGITHRVAQVIGMAGGLSPDEAVRRFEPHARLVFLMVHGAMTMNLRGTEADDAMHGLLFRTIERVIRDAIAEAAPEDPTP